MKPMFLKLGRCRHGHEPKLILKVKSVLYECYNMISTGILEGSQGWKYVHQNTVRFTTSTSSLGVKDEEPATRGHRALKKYKKGRQIRADASVVHSTHEIMLLDVMQVDKSRCWFQNGEGGEG